KELLQPDERRILARLSPDLAALGPEKEAMPTPKGYAEPTPPESPEIVSRVLAVALRAVAQTVPHILILEDVQWSDAGVRQALEALLPLLTESRLCVFMSARREALPLEGEVWQWLEALERRAVLSLLPLPPLSEAESSHLAVQALGSALPEAQFLASLYLASGGNPLFLLELIRDWQERSAEATWEDYLADLPRTGQVEAVIGERLARLAKPALRLLEMAAVLGLESSVEALQKMAAVKSETFLARTDELLRARLLLETEAGFEFAHDLTRGVVLSGLTPKRRRALHRRAGRALQATQPLTIEAIANHWEAGEDWEQASDYLRQAGARAAAACAYPLALQFYRRALSALAQPAMGDRTQSRFQILQAQSRVFLILGDAAAMLEAAQELLSLAGELGDEEEQARAYNHLSAAHFWRGDYLASRSAAEAALAHARRAGAPDLEAWALDRLGQSYGGTGEFDQTRSLFEAALRGFEALHDQVGLSYVTGALGGLAMRQCDYARAMACYRRARDLTEALDWVSRRWMMEANLAMVEYSSGKFESALQRCAVAYAEFERWGMASYALGGVADQLARINLTLGRPAAALDWAARAQAHTDEAGYPLGVIYARLTAAAAECALGNFSAALAAARAARDQSRGMNDRNSLAMANWLLAGIERAAGDLPAALHHAETAAQLTHETGLLLIEMQACAEAARTCLEHGDPTAALGWARCGLAARDQIPGPALDSEDLHFAHHQACSAAGLEDAAREALAQAWSDAAIKASQISDPDLRRTFLEHPTNAAIVERIAAEPDAHPQQLVYLPIRLPKSQRLRKSGASNRDLVPVIWTLTAPEDPASPGPRQRRTRLRRLLVEAASQGAEPRQKDLAAALGVTVRTIRTDLKNL
ncbi:MAG: tetratricopeptide repeat protein, partial [Anaerolineales bacterium]